MSKEKYIFQVPPTLYGELKELKYKADKYDKYKEVLDKLQQENKQLKEQNEKEFANYTKFKQKQYDEYLDEINKLIKEKIMIKKISSDWEQTCIKLEQQLDLYKSVISEITKFVDERMYYLKGINLTNYELERISKILNKANKGSDNDE